tara:strand:- start:7189 stop:8424 length:1236 start_codon:yes stop_codon:yes gene_type:complete
MRKILLLFILLSCGLVQANVLITEVYFDPTGTENGGEFVELFNSGESLVEMTGWTLGTKSSAADVKLPDGAVIHPGKFYLVTDTNWEKRDDTSWPEADHEEAITLANNDGFVSLLKGEDVLDRVEWGEDAVLVGQSYHRGKENGSFVDTDTIDDFFGDEPEPHNSSFGGAGRGVVAVEIEVEAYLFSFENITVEDDLGTEGIQLSPVPGKKRIVGVSVVVSGNDLLETVQIDALNSTVNMTSETVNETHNRYSGSFSFWYRQQPGEYNITLTAIGRHTTQPIRFAVTVLPLAGIYLDTATISVQKARPGEEVYIKGDDETNTLDSPTIKNVGNVPLDISISAKEGKTGLGFKDTLFSFDGDTFFSATKELLVRDVNLGLDDFMPLSLKFVIPLNATSGLYTAALAVTAVGG